MFHRLKSVRVSREHLVAFALLFNTFSWYYLGQLMVPKMGYAFAEGSFESLVLGLIYPTSIILSGVLGAVFLAKTRKLRFFYAWLGLGVLASLVSAFPLGSSFAAAAAVTCLLGVSLGVGVPLCLGYFTKSVSIENRGKVGGLVLFGTFFSVPFAYMVLSALDLSVSAVMLALWRVWCLPLLPLVSRSEGSHVEVDVQKVPSLSSVAHNRTFLLYFAAWLMFALVNGLEGGVVNLAIGEFRFFIRIVEPAIAGFSTLVAGVLSDWVGRKRVLIVGFVSLGMAYATVGLFPQTQALWIFYFIVDGVAIGSLWVLFTIVLWGDLSGNGSERFYAVGETPFFLTEIFALVLAPYLTLIPSVSAFSLAAFFLFLAVVPLLAAPETLPEKKLRERELKIYIKEAQKTKAKHV